MICMPSRGSGQSGHLPSLIRVFAVRSSGCYMSKVFMPAKKTSFRSDHAYAQTDLLLCEHMPLYLFCFAVARPIHLGSTEMGISLRLFEFC